MGAHSGKVNSMSHLNKPLQRQHSTHPPDTTNLVEADYNYLVEQTGMSRSEIRSIYDKFVRESVNGELDLPGFIEFYRSLAADPPQFLNDSPEFIFDTFDKDHNGKVSFREFMSAYVLTSSGNLNKKIEYTFELYDLDGNGYLDLDEIYRIVVRIYSLLGDSKKNDDDAVRMAEDIVRKLDVNPRDGKVSKDEYVAGLLNDPSLRLLITPFVA